MEHRHFFMVRHGETELNLQKRATGWLDTPLTETGREQAAACRGILQALGFMPGRIVHSGLSRTRQTAEIINAAFNRPMLAAPALNEQRFGDWEGQPWDDIRPHIGPGGPNPPNGEPFADFAARIRAGFQEQFAEADETILFVLHGGVFEALGHAFGARVTGIRNGVPYEFRPSGSATGFPWRLMYYTEEKGSVAAHEHTVPVLDSKA